MLAATTTLMSYPTDNSSVTKMLQNVDVFHVFLVPLNPSDCTAQIIEIMLIMVAAHRVTAVMMRGSGNKSNW